jgi:hypothetical protein
MCCAVCAAAGAVADCDSVVLLILWLWPIDQYRSSPFSTSFTIIDVAVTPAGSTSLGVNRSPAALSLLLVPDLGTVL